MSLEVAEQLQPQRFPRAKLFRLSSEDEPSSRGKIGSAEGESRPESPLLLARDKSAATLLRVSTQSSALNANLGRQDSSR
uniref:Uncharacterized protein n=1 Tax=Trichogramma kaykai TaxID=54128 RepID=A0ABD2VZ88_9HYME